MKLLVALILLLPSLSFANSYCELRKASAETAYRRADKMNVQYADAQETYARELKQNQGTISADQARLMQEMEKDIAAEYARLDQELRAESATMTDVNGNLSPVYLRLRKETDARIAYITEKYTKAMGEVANSYGAASFEKVMKAYKKAKEAALEAEYAYQAAVEACQ